MLAVDSGVMHAVTERYRGNGVAGLMECRCQSGQFGIADLAAGLAHGAVLLVVVAAQSRNWLELA